MTARTPWPALAAARLALLLPLVLPACLAPRATLVPRYFQPAVPGGGTPEAPSAPPGTALALHRVDARSYLRERIVWRLSDVEVGFYELRRWTDPPGVFVERALARALFEQRGLTRAVPGEAPALEVQVTAFEERLAPAHEALVELAVSLADRKGAPLVHRRVAASRAVASDDPVLLARAMGEALRDVVREVSDLVVEALTAIAASALQGPRAGGAVVPWRPDGARGPPARPILITQRPAG